MNKVIIITRSGEYDSQEDFSKAISSMNECATNQDLAVISFRASQLAAKEWENAGGKNDQEGAAKKLNLDYKSYEQELQKGSPEPERVMISVLEKRLMDNLSSPYARFKTDDFEVILVLPERLQVGNDEPIPEFSQFIEAVAKDCNVEGCENILYIHDTQLNGNTADDTTIYNREKNIDYLKKDDYRKLKGFENRFKFIAIFRHYPTSTSYFQSQILTKKFGRPNLLDKLIDIEQQWTKDFNIKDEIIRINKQEL